MGGSTSADPNRLNLPVIFTRLPAMSWLLVRLVSSSVVKHNNFPKTHATSSKVSLEWSIKNQEDTPGSSQIAFWYLMVIGNAT
jgi:hypothetical protein